MRSWWRLLPILFLLAMPLLVASCGDDDEGTTGPSGQQADIPEVPQAEFESDADFNSTDQNATTAEGMVDGMLMSASGLAALGQAFMAPLGSADWDDAGDGSWEWTYTEGGCSWAYEAHETAGGYEWSLTLNGNCSGTVYANWVAMDATSNAAGTEGTVRIYAENSTQVEIAWAWTVAADGNSGNWIFYQGGIGTQYIAATFDWVKNADDSEDMTWTVPEGSKWEAHVASGGDSGWMKFYDWESAAWVMTMEIVWNSNGTGTWTTYNPDGSVESELTW